MWINIFSLGAFLVVQILPVSFAQEMMLDQKTLMPVQSVQSAASNPQPEKPQTDKSSVLALQDAAKPLFLQCNPASSCLTGSSP